MLQHSTLCFTCSNSWLLCRRCGQMICWHARCRAAGAELWFALYKTTASVNAPTYWLDGNPSTYRWWGPGDPNENVQCIRITSTGFKDRPCNLNFQYACKKDAGKLTEAQHLRPSGVLSCWLDGLELSPGFYTGSNEQHRLF